MKELLVKVNGEVLVKEMSFEEAWKEILETLAYRNASKYFNTNHLHYNDLIQLQMIDAWKGYESYDIQKGALFFTHAFKYLQRGVSSFFKNLNAQKRGEGVINESLDFSIDGGSSSTENYNFKPSNVDIERDYEVQEVCEEILTKYVTDSITADMLKVIADRDNFTAAAFATKYNMSRQGANQKIHRFQDKIIKNLKPKYYEGVQV